MESTLLAGDISKQTHDTILKQLENLEAITQQLNQATMRPQQQAPDKEEFSMAPRLNARRQQNQPGFNGPPPTRDNLIAGLLLGSPEFQRR
jgi:outer membrane murein-binding lipoprotein Lpp